MSAESLHSFDETQSFSGQSSGSAKEAWSIAGQLERKYQNVEKFGLVEVKQDFFFFFAVLAAIFTCRTNFKIT